MLIAAIRRRLDTAFFDGMGRIACPEPVTSPAQGPEADTRAMRSDWEAVGNDIWQAIQKEAPRSHAGQ